MSVHVAESALVAPFGQQLQSFIEKSIDPERVSQYGEEFACRHPEDAFALANDPERLRWLTAIFAFSHFLSEELLRNPDWLFTIADLQHPLSRNDYKQRLSLATPAALDLALFRRRELLRIVLRDVL